MVALWRWLSCDCSLTAFWKVPDVHACHEKSEEKQRREKYIPVLAQTDFKRSADVHNTRSARLSMKLHAKSEERRWSSLNPLCCRRISSGRWKIFSRTSFVLILRWSSESLNFSHCPLITHFIRRTKTNFPKLSEMWTWNYQSLHTLQIDFTNCIFQILDTVFHHATTSHSTSSRTPNWALHFTTFSRSWINITLCFSTVNGSAVVT